MDPSSQPPLDINELIARIREEADRRTAAANFLGAAGQARLPALRVLPRPPSVTWRRTVDPKKERLEALLQIAREKNDGPAGTPKMFRGLTRRQGSYNRALIDALGLLTKSNLQLNKQVRELTESFDAQARWLDALVDHERSDRAWMQAAGTILGGVSHLAAEVRSLRDLRDRLDELEERLQAAEDATAAERARSEHSTAALEEVRSALQKLPAEGKRQTGELEARIASLAASWAGELKGLDDRLTSAAQSHRSQQAEQQSEVRKLIEVQAAQLAALQKAQAELATEGRQKSSALESAQGELGTKLEQRLTEFAELAHSLRTTQERLQDALVRNEERQLSDAAFIKAQLSYQMLRLEENSPTASESTDDTPTALTSSPSETASLDALYFAFENRFRGERQDVKERLTVYLPFLRERGITGEHGRVIDLGCGRGEWLELLREHEVRNLAGVDLNEVMVQQCRMRDLEVTREDCVEALRAQSEGSCELITAFHLVEHLPLKVLMAFLGQIHHTLRPGGLLILETPNPRNILVGASDFYRDMTHRNPIHPDTLSFVLETLGFQAVKVFFLADAEGARTAVPQEEFRFDNLSSYVDVPRDFAVLASKA